MLERTSQERKRRGGQENAKAPTMRQRNFCKRWEDKKFWSLGCKYNFNVVKLASTVYVAENKILSYIYEKINLIRRKQQSKSNILCDVRRFDLAKISREKLHCLHLRRVYSNRSLQRLIRRKLVTSR